MALLALVATTSVSLTLSGGSRDGLAAADERGDVEAGREQFAASCAACHGPDAGGQGTVPAIDDAVARLGVEQVRSTIEQGRGGMPAFAGTLDEQQIDDVVAYLGELSEGADVDAADERSRGPGEHHGPMQMMRDAGPWAVTLISLLFVTALVAIVVAVRAAGRGPGPSDADEPPG